MPASSPPSVPYARIRCRWWLAAVRLLPAILVIIPAEPAWAVQSHGGREGLVAHQLGHLLFAGGMLFLLVRSRLSHWSGPGWHSFRGFLLLIIFWNVLTFAGHQAELAIPDESFLLSGSRMVGFHVDSFVGLLYYFANLDHLLLLPSLLLLLFALKHWADAPEPGP